MDTWMKTEESVEKILGILIIQKYLLSAYYVPDPWLEAVREVRREPEECCAG